MKKLLLILIVVLSSGIAPLMAQVTIMAEDVTTCNNTSLDVHISVENFTSVTAMSFPVVWDENVVSYAGVTINLPPVTGLNDLNSSSGEIFFSWFDPSSPPPPPGVPGLTLADGTVILTLHFNVIGNYTIDNYTPVELISPGLASEVYVGGSVAPSPSSFLPGSVTIEDTENPGITDCPSDTSVTVPFGQTPVSVSWVPPMAQDNCALMSFPSTHSPGDLFPEGITPVSYTAFDEAGNDSTCVFNVSVVEQPDTSAITFRASDVYLSCGDTMVTMTVNVFNFDDPTAMQFGLAWDSTILEYQSTTIPPGFPSLAGFNDGFAGSGELRYNWADFTAPIGDEVFAQGELILTVEFIYINPAVDSTPVQFSAFTNPPFPIKVADTSGVIDNSDVVFLDAMIYFNQDAMPTFDNCPMNMSVPNDAGQCGAIVSWPAITATDDCDGPVPTMQTGGPASGSQFPVGPTTVTYTATDSQNQTATCSFTVMVNDTESPSITCPGGMQTLNADANCEATLPDYTGLATVSDNCPGTTVSQQPAIGSTINDTLTVDLIATDGAGLTNSCSFTVAFVDVTAPSISCPVNITVGNDPDSCNAVVTWTAPSRSDNCMIMSVDSTHASGDLFVVGTTTVTYNVNDEAGNTNSCSFDITVTDTVIPDITCPVDISIDADAGSCDAVATWADPIAKDNCGVSAITCDPPSGSTFPVGSTSVMCIAEDPSGNRDTCFFNVTVTDNQTPTLACPADTMILVPTGTMDTVINDIGLVSSGDNCGIDTTYFRLDGATTGEGPDDASGTAFMTGMTTVTYFVEDEAGNIDSCSFNVDIVASIILTINCPSDITEETDAGECSAVVNTDAPDISPSMGVAELFYELSDATNGSGTDSIPDDQVFNAGSTIATYTAVSTTGDTSVCSFTILVEDKEVPKFTNCPSVPQTLVNTPGTCGLVTDANIFPVATDNCPGVLVVCNFMAGDVLPLGTTTVNCSATDASGNSVNCSYDLTIEDTEAPTVNNCPGNIAMFTDPNLCGAIVDWTEPTASDNCGVIAFSVAPLESGDFFQAGTTPVTYTAVDAAGNVTECTFNVVVNDNQPPAIQPCPGNMVNVPNDQGACSAVVSWPSPSASDNCGVVSFSATHQPGTIFQVGTAIVTYTATDAKGNSTTCSFLVTVVDNEFPTINNLPTSFSVNAAQGECGATVGWIVPTASDNCGIDNFTGNFSPGSFFGVTQPGNPHEIMYTAEDIHGNVTVESFTITVVDNQDPQVDCPGDVLISTDGSLIDDPDGIIASYNSVSCDAMEINLNSIQASDNCGIAAITQTEGPSSGSVFPEGSNTMTFLITDWNGNQVTCSFDITVVATDDANEGAFPANPCEGDDVQFFADVFPNAVYIWKDPSGSVVSNDPSFTLPGITADKEGTYTLDIILSFNCILSGSVDIDVFGVPDVEISHNDIVCTDGSLPLVLSATDQANSGITQWIWELPNGSFVFGQNITIINATSADSGIYEVTATNANGCSSTDSQNIVIFDEPQMPSLIGEASQACTGEEILLDGEEFSGNGIEYHWFANPDAGSGLTDIDNDNVIVNPSLPGTYTYYYYVTQGNCTSDTAEWVIDVQGPPSLAISMDGATDCVSSDNTITLTEDGGNAASWSWTGPCVVNGNSNVLTIDNATASCSGTYTVTGTSSYGCENTASVNIAITNQPATPTLFATDSTLCKGSSTNLIATPVYSGATYIWTGNSVPGFASTQQNIPVTPSQTGVLPYTFAAVVNGCTSAVATVELIVDDPPPVSISTSGDTKCLNGSTTVSLVPNTPNANTWTWSLNGAVISNEEVLEIPNATSANSGTYFLTVSGTLEECQSTGSFMLNITDALPGITAVLLSPACEDSDLKLCSEPEIPGATYQWMRGTQAVANSRCPVIPNASTVLNGDYTVTASRDGCSSTSASVPVAVLTAPTANDETVVGLVNTAQSFNVVVNDVLASDDYTISVLQEPTNGNVVYNGSGVFTYTPEMDFRETDRMAYEICYTDCPDACDIALVNIQVRFPGNQCIVTTVITPNDDGINDNFVVSCLEVQNFPQNELVIFNQWGDKVFSAAPYNNDWKGTYGEKDLPDGTYFYIFKRDRDAAAENGFVMIHR